MHFWYLILVPLYQAMYSSTAFTNASPLPFPFARHELSHDDANSPKKNKLRSLRRSHIRPVGSESTTNGISLYATRSLDIDRPDHHDFSSEVNLFQEIAKILANWK